jgi:hypothetical protein
MAKDSPVYTIPAEYVEEAQRLEGHLHQMTGHAVAGVLADVTDPDVRAEIGGLMMAMSAALGNVINGYETLRRRLAQRAYEDGKRDGFMQLAEELGMIEKPKDDANPPILH